MWQHFRCMFSSLNLPQFLQCELSGVQFELAGLLLDNYNFLLDLEEVKWKIYLFNCIAFLLKSSYNLQYQSTLQRNKFVFNIFTSVAVKTWAQSPNPNWHGRHATTDNDGSTQRYDESSSIGSGYENSWLEWTAVMVLTRWNSKHLLNEWGTTVQQ